MSQFHIDVIKNELRTDSRLLASMLDHRHRTILENVDKYLAKFSELGRVPFETGTLETAGGTQAQRYALLNEEQCYFLLTLMRNNDRVVNAKLALVKAFREARRELALREIARQDSKQIRRIETDSIKALVDYATAKGSQSADRYYANITKMTNELLGITSGQRNNLDVDSLQKLGALETMVGLAIRDGLRAELDYKEIYQLAKARCLATVQALSIQIGGVK